MSRRIDKTTIPFLENAGYGKGTNFSIDLVASLMLRYADSVFENKLEELKKSLNLDDGSDN